MRPPLILCNATRQPTWSRVPGAGGAGVTQCEAGSVSHAPVADAGCGFGSPPVGEVSQRDWDVVGPAAASAAAFDLATQCKRENGPIERRTLHRACPCAEFVQSVIGGSCTTAKCTETQNGAVGRGKTQRNAAGGQMGWTETSLEQDDIISELAHKKRLKMVSRNRICLSNVNGTRFSPVSCGRQRQHALSVSNDVATHLTVFFA